jgi:nucleotide-binding universal stress UspA family protein
MQPAYPRILCPVDFSEPSRTALAYAMAVADHFKAALSVLTVSDDLALLETLDCFMAPLLHQVVKLSPPPAAIVRPGIPGDVVLEVARQQRIDLVVMATHGQGASTAPYGSTTLHVLRHTRVPVLIIPPAVRSAPSLEAEGLMRPDQVVLAPVDLQPRAVHDASLAAGIADAYGVPLVLLHVVPASGEETESSADAACAELIGRLRMAMPRHHLVVRGEPAVEIDRVAVERHAGLLVMGLRGTAGQEGAPPGTVAFGVLGRAPAPVLAIPDMPVPAASAAAGGGARRSEPGRTPA